MACIRSSNTLKRALTSSDTAAPIETTGKLPPIAAYARAKLAMVTWSSPLAEEEAGTSTTVVALCPGLNDTPLSAAMTGFAGALYCQYQMFISPDTVSGISVSLQMVFAVVVGGLYVLMGPTIGAIITILLAEGLRIGFGTGAIGFDNLIYGALLVVFIIFLPHGILGSIQARFAAAR